MTNPNHTFKRGIIGGLLVAVTLTITLSCSGGGTSGEASATAVKAYDSFRASDWAGYAQALHPTALDRYEALLRPAFDVMIKVDSAGNMPEEFQWFDTSINTQQFMNMPPEEFFAFSMAAMVKIMPGLGEALGGSSMEVIGEVAEGDSLVHVVARTSAEAQGMQMTEVSVLTMTKSDGEFLMMLPQNIEGLARTVAQGMQGR